MCHPTWWRGLYAEEVEQLTDDLLSDGRSELRLAADLLHGAVTACVWARAVPLNSDSWRARPRRGPEAVHVATAGG
jgi:hypothetical protein